MKTALGLVVVMLLAATPALAGDGNIPQGTLASLGLGDMETVSDAEAMQVRGKCSWFGMVKGTSLIFGQLMTDNTKNFLVSSSVNEVDSNAESTQAEERLFLMKTHGVELHLELDVEGFDGKIQGWAGGIGGVGNYEFSLLDN
jgi:hypothetical protein